MSGAGLDSSASAHAFQERIAALRQSAGFRNYEHVRDRVLNMLAQNEASGLKPSAYWQEELANFEYMFDASPLIVDKLRHHTFHVTGVRVYEYRSGRARMQQRFGRKLKALIAEGKRDLFVPESPVLGGFGFDLDGHLVNLDTLKFFEALIALDRGAVLDDFRGNQERRLVWEIGAGWGGFPYQFKTVCPNVTYVITDLPELFLFSATYLMTNFPDVRVAFWGDGPIERIFASWRDYDFIFLPNTALADLAPPRLDLTVNMVSFQEMTSAQVAAYVERAHALACPFLYSLNRERSSYNEEIESVSEVISRWYWPREVAVLPMSYQKMLDEAPSPQDYKHIVGWRKVPA